MTRSESYLALAILLMGQFVIGPRLGFLPDWGIGVVLGIWFSHCSPLRSTNSGRTSEEVTTPAAP